MCSYCGREYEREQLKEYEARTGRRFHACADCIKRYRDHPKEENWQEDLAYQERMLKEIRACQERELTQHTTWLLP